MRPTIRDLADAAGVSVSTVNRVIKGDGSVRLPTQERVCEAAEKIGFYGLRAIEHTIRNNPQKKHRLGVLLLQSGRVFYRVLGDALQRAADTFSDARVELTLEYQDDLSPDRVAERLRVLGDRCEAVALVAAEHPLVSEAIDTVIAQGVPVSGLISPLTAGGNVGFVGLDSWKVGRTAAWAFDRMCRQRGEIGILVGNHRYRNQDLNESGFRSYFREHNAGFQLLEPLSTFESSAIARELTERLLAEHPDLCGLFISGGGITGALAALRDARLPDGFVSIGYELFDATRAALIDGTLTMVISHPIDAIARETIASLVRAKLSGATTGAQTVNLGFEIYTSENI